MSAASSASGTIRRTIPARLDRLSWSPFHTRMVRRPRGSLDPGRSPDHGCELGDGCAATARHAGDEIDADRADRVDIPSGRGGRRALLRQAVRSAWPKAAADHHAAVVPAGHRASGVRDWQPRRLAAVLLRDAFHRGDGHRRSVRAINSAIDEMMPRSTRAGRHLDQRLLLGGGDHRLVRVVDLPERLRRQRRLATRLPDGAGAGASS